MLRLWTTIPAVRSLRLRTNMPGDSVSVTTHYRVRKKIVHFAYGLCMVYKFSPRTSSK